MALFRRALPLARTALRHRPTAAGGSSTCRQLRHRVQRRGYASEGDHGHAKAGSDWPWAIGSFTVTAATCTWLLTPDLKSDHGHGKDHGAHEEHEKSEDGSKGAEGEEEEEAQGDDAETGGKTEEEEAKDEINKDQGRKDEGSENGETSDDSESNDEDKKDTPDTSDDEGSHVKQGGKDPNSTWGGKGSKVGKTNAEDKGDEPSTQKDPAHKNSTSAKQEGLSNSDTAHSTPVSQSPDKSSKGEGAAETAKLKGSVKPDRPQK